MPKFPKNSQKFPDTLSIPYNHMSMSKHQLYLGFNFPAVMPRSLGVKRWKFDDRLTKTCVMLSSQSGIIGGVCDMDYCKYANIPLILLLANMHH